MELAMITGTVVCSHHDSNLPAGKLAIIRLLDRDMKPTGAEHIVFDTVGAGQGEVVLYTSGSSARMTETTWEKPIDGTIVAVVEEVTRHGKTVFKK